MAWRHSRTYSLHDFEHEVSLADGDEWAEPLYTHPAPQAKPQPLSDEQIREAWIAATKIERERCTKVCERVQAYHAEKAASLAKTDTGDADFHEAEACGAEDCAEALRMGERWFEQPNTSSTTPPVV